MKFLKFNYQNMRISYNSLEIKLVNSFSVPLCSLFFPILGEIFLDTTQLTPQ